MKTKTNQNSKKRTQFCWLAFLAILSYLPINAQQISIVKGTVMNEKSEVMAGVTVKVSSVADKHNYTSATDENGVFIFKKLVTGKAYDFTVSFIGYETGVI